MLVSPERIAGFGDLVSKRTGESCVYWNRAEFAFYKVKNPAAKMPIKRTSPSDWLYEHVIHNILFPEASYEFVGLLEECGEIRIVLKQQAVSTESFPDEDQVVSALADRGLFPEDRYFFGDGVVSVTDVGVHGDNVLLDDEGNVRFIDPLIRLAKPAEDVIEWLTGYDPRVTESAKGFTLIELLVICAILATMVTIGVGSIRSGQGAARVKGATRDIYAAIRHARSVALVTGQPAIITYSTEEAEGEVMAKIEVTSAKLFSSEEGKTYETLSGMPIEGEEGGAAGTSDEGRELVHIRGSKAKSFNQKKGASGSKSDAAAKDAKASDSGPSDSPQEGGGETIEEILFKPMDAEVVKGMRLKVLKDEDDPHASGNVGRKTKISVFSNVDYLIGRFKDAKAEAKKKEDAEKAAGPSSAAEAAAEAKEKQEPVSIVWETNGRVDPHQVWVYADGQEPEDGLLIRIDRFGAAKVLPGDGREDD